MNVNVNCGQPVRLQTVRNFVVLKLMKESTKAILATTTDFKPDAISFSKAHEWELEYEISKVSMLLMIIYK